MREKNHVRPIAKATEFGLWREPGVTHRSLSLACKLTLAGPDRPPGRDDACTLLLHDPG